MRKLDTSYAEAQSRISLKQREVFTLLSPLTFWTRLCSILASYMKYCTTDNTLEQWRATMLKALTDGMVKLKTATL